MLVTLATVSVAILSPVMYSIISIPDPMRVIGNYNGGKGGLNTKSFREKYKSKL